MLQVKNLSIYHKKDLRPLAADLSFTLNDGDKAAIIGEEGNGKSTLLKLLYDPALVDDYAEYKGNYQKTTASAATCLRNLPQKTRRKASILS